GEGILAQRHRFAACSPGTAAEGHRIRTRRGTVADRNGLRPGACAVVCVDADGDVVVADKSAAGLHAQCKVAVTDDALARPVADRGGLVALHVPTCAGTDGDVIGAVTSRDTFGTCAG